ncbi:MAG: ATP-binding protein [Pirellulaceae bacterium]|nr:ATP-binding protein [Pirellulaceae bacterium]
MTTDDTEIVSAVHQALAGKVGNERFELWFGSNTQFALNEGTLAIIAPSRFLRDWLASNFRREIEHACIAVMGHCPPLEFLADETPVETIASTRSSSRIETSRKVEVSKTDATGILPVLLDAGNSRQGSSTGETPVAPSQTPVAPSQTPVAPSQTHVAPGRPTRRHADGKFGPVPRFETFVTGPSNQMARTSAEMILHEPGLFSPLLIHGPTSVGKTHLLQAILAEARRRRLGGSAVYLTSEQFTTHFLDALRGGGLPSFRQKYREVKLLLIDDLQFFRGKRSTLVELLYTVDALVRRRCQLVFAADRPLSELTDLGGDLVARLAAGNECPLRRPEYPTRLGIVGQMARQFGMSVPDEVQAFIAARLTNHARELSGALCRLRATSESLRRPINLAMAEEALAEMIRHSHRVVRLPDIQKAVCDVFGIDESSMQANRRGKRISHPRMLAMWLARKHTRAALSEIGDFFGRRSHSTVVSAQKRVDSWLADRVEVELADRTFSIDEAIERVEQTLLAG